MPHPKVKIADNSGNEVAVTSNALDVNIAGGTADIDIGDVSLLLGGTAASVNTGAIGAQTLRVTLATGDWNQTASTALQTSANSLNSSLVGIDTSLNNIETYIGQSLVLTGGQYAEGNANTTAIVRNDTLASLVTYDNDYAPLQVNASGALYVDVVTLPASTNTIEVVGDAAEDAAVAGNPVLVGGRYDSSKRTLDDGDVGAIALNDHGYVKIDWTGDVGETTGIISAVQTGYGVSDRNLQVAPAIRNDVLAALGNSTDGDWTPMQTDALGAIYTTHGVTGGADNVTVVSTAGTDVVLGGDVACKKVDIQAQTDNTGLIAVGFTGVDATEATGTGVILYAGDTYSLEINNLDLIYIDSTVSGEGVRYTYFT